jgi:hypothetical protein
VLQKSRLIELRLAFLTHALYLFILADDSHPGEFATGWTYKHHIGNVNWPFEFNDSRIHRSTFGLHLALVFLAQINTLNNYPMQIR